MAVNQLECRALALPSAMKTMPDGAIGLRNNIGIFAFGNGLKAGTGIPCTIFPFSFLH